MPHPTNTAQYQRHYIQLISRILNTRPNSSPFTLILDDLNQRAAPLINEIIRRALSRNVNITFLSFETTRLPPPIVTIPCYTDLTREQILSDLKKALSTAKTNGKESLVVIDSLHDLLTTKNTDMSSLFNLIAGEFSATLIGTYHTDILPSQDTTNAYAPLPLDLLKYMATTIITCRSFAHVLSAKAARERSLPEPMHGLLNEAEGVVQDLHANDARGVVLDVEFRRKSGRPESETYFLRAARKEDYGPGQGGMRVGTLKQEFVTLLELEPMYNRKDGKEEDVKGDGEIESTFNLGLTEKQKQAREGVVLPYFDAQKGEGGEGGRILYDMGEEDDFDEEEDEI